MLHTYAFTLWQASGGPTTSGKSIATSVSTVAATEAATAEATQLFAAAAGLASVLGSLQFGYHNKIELIVEA